MQLIQLNGMRKELEATHNSQKITMGELISALQDVTGNDRMVPALFSDLKQRGVIKVDEKAVMQAWLEAPENLRNA